MDEIDTLTGRTNGARELAAKADLMGKLGFVAAAAILGFILYKKARR